MYSQTLLASITYYAPLLRSHFRLSVGNALELLVNRPSGILQQLYMHHLLGQGSGSVAKRAFF